ncbi:MAG: hypothetical protein IJ797_01590, partial [Selenomonadaceae bacterium]|nr:hypothetical protein [Selenomonadaceae bacterium]
MQVKLADHFTYRRLLKFVFPSVVTMIATSIYGVIDRLFVSNFVGKSAFAAINLMMPFIMLSGAFGFMIGTGGSAPIFAYNFGAKNFTELRNIFFKTIKIISVTGLALTISAELLADVMTSIFVGYDENLQSLTVHGFRIYSISFLFAGFNIFASSFFTSMNNRLISAIISVVHTLIYESG